MKHRKLALENFIKKHSLTRGAEIGVWQGETSEHLLRTTGAFLYLVDLWQTSHKYETKKWDHNKNKQMTLNRLKDLTNYKILQGISWEVAEQITDNELDFVFIDGDHSTQGVVNDIKAYTPKVKQDGYIIGHDWDWDTVQKAVIEFNSSPSFLSNGIWYYKKEKRYAI